MFHEAKHYSFGKCFVAFFSLLIGYCRCVIIFIFLYISFSLVLFKSVLAAMLSSLEVNSDDDDDG